MEGTEETKMSESHLSSVVAFVEGGIQDACDDACSICLEDFCESNPSTVTGCKHEFHLQCILEWCQRSSQCPMCWQPISLKDPTSQELLGAVEQERNFRFNRSRNATIFHHPTLGDFELQHLPVDASEAELEEHIIQHLATAAAMGRTRHIARREGHRNRSSAQGRPQLVVFSTHPNAPPIPSSPSQREEGESTHKIAVATPSSPPLAVVTESSPLVTSLPNSQGGQGSAASDSPAGSIISAANQHGNSLSNRGSPNRSSSNSRDRTGPSNFQSLSESIKSRFNAVSMRYKDSISKSTRGWKERFFSQNTSVDDIGSEVREVNAGVASVSRLMEHLETRDNSRTENASVSNANSIDNCSVPESNSQLMMEAGGDSPLRDKNANVQASCAASSGLH